MFNTKIYGSSNVLNKALDASWLRNQTIADNIANVDTPGYKRKDVQFETFLQQALLTGEKASDVNLDTITPSVYVDNQNLSYRMDGNNVNIDTETVNQAKNLIKYNTLINQVNSELNRIKMVIKSR